MPRMCVFDTASRTFWCIQSLIKFLLIFFEEIPDSRSDHEMVTERSVRDPKENKELIMLCVSA